MKKLLLVLVAFATLSGLSLAAQEVKPADVAGTWQGTLPGDKGARTVVKITAVDGNLQATMYNIDTGGHPMSAATTTLQGGTVKFSLTGSNGTYEGKMSADGKTIVGTWTQGDNAQALSLIRTAPADEWPLPTQAPAKPVPPGVDSDPCA